MKIKTLFFILFICFSFQSLATTTLSGPCGLQISTYGQGRALRVVVKQTCSDWPALEYSKSQILHKKGICEGEEISEGLYRLELLEAFIKVSHDSDVRNEIGKEYDCLQNLPWNNDESDVSMVQ